MQNVWFCELEFLICTAGFSVRSESSDEEEEEISQSSPSARTNCECLVRHVVPTQSVLFCD